MVIDPIVLTTERTGLVLRQYRADDARAIFACIDESPDHLSQNGDNTARKYPNLDSVEQSICQTPSSRLRFGIWDGEIFVGGGNLTISLESVELGYWLGAKFTGRGYVTLAAQALIQYTFQVLGYRKVTARVAHTNLPSQAVIERVGLTETSRDKEFRYFEIETDETGTETFEFLPREQ